MTHNGPHHAQNPETPADPAAGLASRHLSLRLRLTFWMVGLFSLVVCSMLGVFWLYERNALEQQMQDALERCAADIAGDVAPLLPDLSDEEVARIRRNRTSIFAYQPLRVEVYGSSGSLIAGESDAPSQSDFPALGDVEPGQAAHAAFPVARLGLVPPDGRSVRAAATSVIAPDRNRYSVVVLTSDATFQRRLRSLTQVAAASGLIGVLAAAASGWFIAGVAVAPFERLRTIAQRLEPGERPGGWPHVSPAADVAGLSEELEYARQRISERFAAQERFLSHVSHEIKTPIAIVLVEAQTLDIDGATDDVRKFVASTQDELTRLGRLLESLLALTRIRNGERFPRILSCVVNDVAMDSLQACSTMALQHNVKLTPQLLDGDDAVDASVSGDPELLRTLLDSLVRNAIRYSPEHSRVEVRLTCDEHTVTISVLDQGPGVPPDVLPTVFDRFVPPRETTRAGRGHGLGLAIAQGIAELHGGRIVATNRDAGGCVFTVTLPRSGAPEPTRFPGQTRNGQAPATTPPASASA